MTALTQGKQIYVSVAHRDPYVAAGIASLLRSHADFVVRSGSADDNDCDDLVDVIVTDYATGIRKATGAVPSRRGVASKSLLVVTDESTGWHIRRAVDAGVRGYLLHDCSAQELSDATRCVANGRRYLSSVVTDQLVDNLTAVAPTARELEVLQLIAHGLANMEIGRRLGIGEGTVKTHVKALMRKLGESKRTAVIAEAHRRGLVMEPKS